jgi:hypothetical protein
MAEIELSAISKQCLDRRIGKIEKLADEVGAWERERNRIKAGVRLEFKKNDAREKLHRHYLNLQN